MNSGISLSLGVVFENNKHEIERLVSSLCDVDLSYLNEIIVVDNCSNEDDTLPIFDKLTGVGLVKIRNENRMSLPYNRNIE